MNFTFMFKFFPWLMLTPWILYFLAAVFGGTCGWEKGRKERFIISIVLFFFGTAVLGILVWPGSYEAIADVIKANYYFPKGEI